ncbi:NUDIX hydrolase [Zavarzinia sp. CC-PAN008]|uniref:NUDIX hydrolase n=1 Tax=Zavarzinia sp. CC-PAN008 TaxID=3243332 RepID=UPI003F7482CC
MSGRERPARPIVGVGAIVWRGDSVLLVRRAKPPRAGEWSIPGGAQKVGETVREAAIREVFEETGVTMAPGPVVDVVDGIFRDEEGAVLYHYTLVDLAGTWLAGEPRAGDDAADARFVPMVELDALALWTETARVIAQSRTRLAAD